MFKMISDIFSLYSHWTLASAHRMILTYVCVLWTADRMTLKFWRNSLCQLVNCRYLLGWTAVCISKPTWLKVAINIGARRIDLRNINHPLILRGFSPICLSSAIHPPFIYRASKLKPPLFQWLATGSSWSLSAWVLELFSKFRKSFWFSIARTTAENNRASKWNICTDQRTWLWIQSCWRTG